jgi:hypothetical protein
MGERLRRESRFITSRPEHPCGPHDLRQPSSRLKSGDPARLYWNKESFRLGEFLLIPVEREELCYSQMECGGNVKDVSQTMSRCESVSTAQSLSPLMHR